MPEIIDQPTVLNPELKDTPALPPMYAVILWNDTTTYPKFVVKVLREAFAIEESAAYKIMVQAHFTGQALVKVLTKDLAETAINQAMTLAESAQSEVDFAGEVCELMFSMRPD